MTIKLNVKQIKRDFLVIKKGLICERLPINSISIDGQIDDKGVDTFMYEVYIFFE